MGMQKGKEGHCPAPSGQLNKSMYVRDTHFCKAKALSLKNLRKNMYLAYLHSFSTHLPCTLF